MILRPGEWCETCNGIGSVTPDHPNDPNGRVWPCEECDGAGWRQFRCDGCQRRIGIDEAHACIRCQSELCRRCHCSCDDEEGSDCTELSGRSTGCAKAEQQLGYSPRAALSRLVAGALQ